MEARDGVCLLELTAWALRVIVSAEGELQQWQIDAPSALASSIQRLEYHVGTGNELSALDELLSRAANVCNITGMTRVLLLTHNWGLPLLYTYVLRWLRAAVYPATVVSVLPCALFALQCAGVSSALVVHGQDGVLIASPVQDGVVCAEVEVVWGSVSTSAFPHSASIDDDFDRVARCTADPAWSEPGSPGGTREASPSESCQVPPHELAITDSLLHAVDLQVSACKRRELHGALATVVLSGQAAALPSARRCVALLLSHVLPQSTVTWV